MKNKKGKHRKKDLDEENTNQKLQSMKKENLSKSTSKSKKATPITSKSNTKRTNLPATKIKDKESTLPNSNLRKNSRNNNFESKGNMIATGSGAANRFKTQNKDMKEATKGLILKPEKIAKRANKSKKQKSNENYLSEDSEDTQKHVVVDMDDKKEKIKKKKKKKKSKSKKNDATENPTLVKLFDKMVKSEEHVDTKSNTEDIDKINSPTETKRDEMKLKQLSKEPLPLYLDLSKENVTSDDIGFITDDSDDDNKLETPRIASVDYSTTDGTHVDGNDKDDSIDTNAVCSKLVIAPNLTDGVISTDIEAEVDIEVIAEKENELTYFQHEADKITDPEIQYLGEKKVPQLPESTTLVMGEAMEPKANKEKILEDIKKEYEEQLEQKEKQFQQQNNQITALNEQMAAILLLLNSKEKQNDAVKESVDNHNNDLESSSDNSDDSDDSGQDMLKHLDDETANEIQNFNKPKCNPSEDGLVIMSKIIDKALVHTNILPDAFTASYSEPNDEISLSKSSMVPEKRKSVDNSKKNIKKIKISSTQDELHEPSLDSQKNTTDKKVLDISTSASDSDDESSDTEKASDKGKIKDATKGDPKAKVFKTQSETVREELKIYDVSKGLQFSSSSQDSLFSPHKGGASSSLESRMLVLDQNTEGDHYSRFTGNRTSAFVDENINKNIPSDTWEKYSWADKYTPILSQDDIKAFVVIHKVEHLYDEIAPWFCTIMPLDPYDRRYFTILVDGE